MKKLLTLTALCALLTAPATAVQKCVALDETSTCSATFPENLSTDWSAQCSTNETVVNIKGLSLCSNKAGDTNGDTADYITMSGSINENIRCWCRIISPGVTPWVYLVTLDSSFISCMVNCRAWCMQSVKSNSGILTSLMSY
ncbi:MAG: hypothetical protein IKB05_01630 [Alphaproteobacteria bacterium]|nr:hypothetical protein [Alphaproteobacteria bacterium]